MSGSTPIVRKKPKLDDFLTIPSSIALSNTLRALSYKYEMSMASLMRQALVTGLSMRYEEFDKMYDEFRKLTDDELVAIRIKMKTGLDM